MGDDITALRQHLVAPDSHAGGDCQCACFDAGFDTGVDAALAELECVGWIAVGGPDDGQMHDNSSCGRCEKLGASIVPGYRVSSPTMGGPGDAQTSPALVNPE